MHAPPSADVLAVPTASASHRAVNGVDLHVVAAGDPADPLVVLLHGFPEFWYGWHESVAPLVDAGYRVLVPDQRGYGRSEKPGNVRDYRVTELVADIAALVATEDRETAHVVGHDWGAIVAWELARRRPELLNRLAIVNVPHPTAFRRAVRSNLAQLRKSWYVCYFQLPWLPEWLTRLTDYRPFETAMRDGARPGTFDDRDMARYRTAWAQDGALKAMLDWYRAFVRCYEDAPRDRVDTPTLIVWGERDQALVPELATASVTYCTDARLERYPDATHWIAHEYPERVATDLIEHLEGTV